MFVNGSGQNVHSLERTAHRSFLPSKRFQRRRIKKNQPIRFRNKNCLWRPYLVMDRNKISNLYRGPSIDASYQASVHLAEGFQRRRLKCEKLTDDIRRTPSDGKSLHCFWQGELKTKNKYVLKSYLAFYRSNQFLDFSFTECSSVLGTNFCTNRQIWRLISSLQWLIIILQ